MPVLLGVKLRKSLTFCDLLQVLVVVFFLLPWYDVNMRNVIGKARRICNMVADGRSVLDACKRVRVNRATFYRWAARRPEVAEMYQEACQARLDAVENELAVVRDEMARVRATVPAVRPREGVSVRAYIRALGDMRVPAHVLNNMHPRMSRRAYQKKRREMWQNMELLREWLYELRLERARLLGRLERCGA